MELIKANQTKDSGAAKTLHSLMRDVSEDTFSAGWVVNLEFILWEHITSPGSFPKDLIATEFDNTLKTLYEMCGCWAVYPKSDVYKDAKVDGDCYGYHCFLTLEEWEKVFNRVGPEKIARFKSSWSKYFE